MSMPRDFTVNGIGSLGISVASETEGVRPLQENTDDFTGLAFSIHAGVSILEKPEGRQTLERVGATVVREWASQPNGFRFGGDPTQMETYVKNFLSAVRGDFPRVILSDLGGPSVIATAKRIPLWDGNLSKYVPKAAGGLYYNRSRVSQMATAASRTDRRNHGGKMATRFRTFLFMFAVATAHELTHLFIGYLAQGQNSDESYTPPGVSHLNYGQLRDRHGPPTGESGRWLESRLFGGSLEFYRDILDDNDQAGIPHLVDSSGLAWKIHPNCVMECVTRLEEFQTFPFATTGTGLTFPQRQARGLLNLGSTEARGSEPGVRHMRARREGPQPLYDISASELNRVPLEPRRILRMRQVA